MKKSFLTFNVIIPSCRLIALYFVLSRDNNSLSYLLSVIKLLFSASIFPIVGVGNIL